MRKTYLTLIPQIFFMVIIFFVGILIYANSLHSAFQFDDLSYIENNPAIYDINNLKAIIDFHRSRPLGTYTFALNYHFHGLDVFGYHLVNLAIHLITSFFVWWFIKLTFISQQLKGRYLSYNGQGIAFFTALFFVSHPSQTQAVSYITQRYSSLSAMFYLASLSFYLKARLTSREGKPAGAYYGTVFLTAFLGALTKETLITLPLIIILCEFFFFAREDWIASVKKKWLYYLISFLGIVFIIGFRYGFDLPGIFAGRFISDSHDGDIITAQSYFLTQPKVILTYLRLLFIPFGQNLDYDFSVSKSFFEGPTMLSFFLILLILLAAFGMRQKKPLISFGIFFFFITLSVESSVIPIPHLIFEHRLYLPSVGFCLTLCLALYELLKNIRIFTLIGVCICLVFSYLTIERNKVWQNEITLWEDAVRKSSRKARPYDNLGSAYLKAGRYKEARAALQKALSMDPHVVTTYINLGEVALASGELDEAENYLMKALNMDPNSAAALNNLGVVFLRKKDLEHSEQKFLDSIKLKKGYIEPKLNLAKVYIEKKEYLKAINLYEEIHQDYPHDRHSLLGLLKLYLEQNEKNKVFETANKILKEIKEPACLTESGSLCASRGFNSLAMAFYAKSLRVNPKYKEAYLELGKFYGNLEQFNRAIVLWQDGSKIDPTDQRFTELIQRALELQALPAGKE